MNFASFLGIVVPPRENHAEIMFSNYFVVVVDISCVTEKKFELSRNNYK